jgi:hypothetical protein
MSAAVVAADLASLRREVEGSYLFRVSKWQARISPRGVFFVLALFSDSHHHCGGCARPFLVIYFQEQCGDFFRRTPTLF